MRIMATYGETAEDASEMFSRVHRQRARRGARAGGPRERRCSRSSCRDASPSRSPRWGPRPGASPAATSPRASHGRQPDELASLADSFNQMAAELEESERQRRDLIANTAHELRTPLTNLEGYLEGIRDGVIPADRQTYDSLLEEAERLVRLARSLDDLAAGRSRDGRDRTPVDVDLAEHLAAAAELARPAFDARRLTLERRWPARYRRASTPTSSRRCSRTCSRTPPATRPSGGIVMLAAEPRPGTILVSLTNHGEDIPAERPAARVRALLPRREVARPGSRRRRHRPRHRQAARGGLGRPVGAESGAGPHALLVQPPADARSARALDAEHLLAGHHEDAVAHEGHAQPLGKARLARSGPGTAR